MGVGGGGEGQQFIKIANRRKGGGGEGGRERGAREREVWWVARNRSASERVITILGKRYINNKYS